MNENIRINIRSEIGELEAVMIHDPGPEVENMTPGNAERALYSDILNLSVARKEYSELEGILGKFSQVFKVKDLLSGVLKDQGVKEKLVERVCSSAGNYDLCDHLLQKSNEELAGLFIEGVVMQKNTLTKYLSRERYSLLPLHNFFFIRDAAIPMPGNVLISKMANKVRERESIILQTIFDSSGFFDTKTLRINGDEPRATIEGGDVLIARDDIIITGIGTRTTSHGIDRVLDMIKSAKQDKMNVIVQELPLSPESFIHLDMVFTLLDRDLCMVYEPVIYRTSKFQTVHITIDNGKVSSISEVRNIPEVLKSLGMDLKPVYCGGRTDVWTQEREQWHSGANFFALAPGKVIGYERNTRTLDELNNNGFEILSARDVLSGKSDPDDYKKAVIALKGSELPRGGGGARCMTLPLGRKAVIW
jgi:arginine deiminase